VCRRDHTHALCLHAVHHAFCMQWHSNERRDLLFHGSLKTKNTDLQHVTSIEVRGRHTVWHAFGGTRVVMYCFVCTHGLRTSYDVCMHIYAYTHTHTYIYTHTHAHMHIYMYIYIHNILPHNQHLCSFEVTECVNRPPGRSWLI
jgi:hypothetical protein